MEPLDKVEPDEFWRLYVFKGDEKLGNNDLFKAKF